MTKMPEPKSTQQKEDENLQYGKGDFRVIDPDLINPEDYARNLRGDEKHFGDVREYMVGDNRPHPDTNVKLDDLMMIGTTFTTELLPDVTLEIFDFPKTKDGASYRLSLCVTEVAGLK